MFDKEALREDADCIVLAEQMEIPMKRHGNKYMILCPNHADRHMGSCFLTSKGYQCYSCHHTGDVFDFVQKTLGVNFQEACRYIADACGGEDLYQVSTATGVSSKTNSELGLPFLPKKWQQYLGIEDSPVYLDIGTCYFAEKDEYLDAGYIVEPFDNNGLPEYRVLKCASHSPLRDLYFDSPNIYIDMVDAAIEEKRADVESFFNSVFLFMDSDGINKMYQDEMQKLQDIAATYGSKPVTVKDSGLVEDLYQAWNSGGF